MQMRRFGCGRLYEWLGKAHPHRVVGVMHSVLSFTTSDLYMNELRK